MSFALCRLLLSSLPLRGQRCRGNFQFSVSCKVVLSNGFCFSLQGCGPPLPCHGATVLQLCSPYKLYGVLVFAGCGRERACIGPDPIRVVPICRFAPAGRCQLQFCIIGIPYFVKVVVARSQRLRVQSPSRRWARGTSPPQGRVDFFSRVRLGTDPERVFPSRGA